MTLPEVDQLDAIDLDAAALRLAALGQPTRLAIYRTLVRAAPLGCAVGDIQTRTGIPQSTLSFHLRRLIEVGLVSQDRQGTTLVCRADAAAMSTTLGFLARECCADTCSVPAPSASRTPLPEGEESVIRSRK